jgi:deferrochelatase/peroxidase EfeB
MARSNKNHMAITPLFRLNRPLSRGDLTTYKAVLSRLQGNILKSHGREFAQHVFLTFRPETRDRARRFLSSLADPRHPKLTSKAEQRAQTQRNPHGKELFASLCISAKGYRYLGYSKPKGFSQEFWQGMRAAKVGDPPPSEWEPAFQRDLHAMA